MQTVTACKLAKKVKCVPFFFRFLFYYPFFCLNHLVDDVLIYSFDTSYVGMGKSIVFMLLLLLLLLLGNLVVGLQTL